MLLQTTKDKKEKVLDTDTAAYNSQLANAQWQAPANWDWHTLEREATSLRNSLYDTWHRFSKYKAKQTCPREAFLEEHAYNTKRITELRDSGKYSETDGAEYKKTYAKDKRERFRDHMDNLESGFDLLTVLKRKKKTGLTILQEKNKTLSIEDDTLIWPTSS